MTNLTSNPAEERFVEILVSPHAVCHSCGGNSGPVFQLSKLRGPSSYHRKNEILHGLHAESTHSDIEKAEADITRLNDEIDRIQEVLTSLQKRRDDLEKFKYQENSLFAPIRRLPEDLLRLVFLLYQRNNECDGCINVYDPKALTRTITQVCAHWRVVAHDHPELWSWVSMYRDETACRVGDAAVGPFLEMCISLSKELPLHLSFTASHTMNILGDRCMQSIADAAYRWKYITINDGELLNDIMSRISPDVVLSSLERLSLFEPSHSLSVNPSPKLSRLDISYIRHSASTTISLMSAPSLRNLTLLRMPFPSSIFVDFPFAQITCFKSDSNIYLNDELCSILNSMPNLKSFTLKGVPNISTPVVLQSLKDFTLSGLSAENKDILDVFTAPHIDTLRLERDLDSSSIGRFFNRSHCPLMNFRIRCTPLTKEWITQSSSLRDVKNLFLYRPYSILNDLRLLTWNQANTPRENDQSDLVFPRLRSLAIFHVTLDRECETTEVVQTLIDMLKSRIVDSMENRRKECTLKFAKIIFEHKLNEDETKALRMFNRSTIVQQSGIVMTITHRRERSNGSSSSTSNSCPMDLIRNGLEIEDVNNRTN